MVAWQTNTTKNTFIADLGPYIGADWPPLAPPLFGMFPPDAGEVDYYVLDPAVDNYLTIGFYPTGPAWSISENWVLNGDTTFLAFDEYTDGSSSAPPSGAHIYVVWWDPTYSSTPAAPSVTPESLIPSDYSSLGLIPPGGPPRSPWYEPPPTFAMSGWIDNARTAPPSYNAQAVAVSWAAAIETVDDGTGPRGSGARLDVEADFTNPTTVAYTIGQTLYALPLQSAWDSSYTYGTSPAITGSGTPNYTVPPDPAAPVPRPPGAVAFWGNGDFPTPPYIAQMRIKPAARRTDLAPTFVANYQGVESITVYELPTASPYHPSNTGGVLEFVPRSVLTTMTPLWSGVPVNGVTVEDLILTLPADWYDTTSLLVVPTAMLSTTAPTVSSGAHWVEFLDTAPEVRVQYQGAKYLIVYSAALTIPPLRQFHRDDGLAGGARSQVNPTSRQASQRQGINGTYL